MSGPHEKTNRLLDVLMQHARLRGRERECYACDSHNLLIYKGEKLSSRESLEAQAVTGTVLADGTHQMSVFSAKLMPFNTTSQAEWTS